MTVISAAVEQKEKGQDGRGEAVDKLTMILDENVIKIMWEAGIEISRQRLKPLALKLLDWADKAVESRMYARLASPQARTGISQTP